MTTVLVTIQRGRHDHLRNQIRAVGSSTRRPRAHVVVSMDDVAPELDGCEVVALPSGEEALPLAAARNAGIAHARRRY
ncbi:MAG: hypothetical protein Q7T55_08760, partial [Solirubrobacteraceae bacterium]|nr:hypothetical protein [Solirubrobacteraceae bacterium]